MPSGVSSQPARKRAEAKAKAHRAFCFAVAARESLRKIVDVTMPAMVSRQKQPVFQGQKK